MILRHRQTEKKGSSRQEISFITFRCQVKISQLTAPDQKSKERKVNNLDIRAALIVAASPPDYIYIYTHVIMMRGKRADKRVGAIRLFWTRHIYTDEMDSGHTRSISVSTSSQYVLDHHSMWIKKYTALFEARRQRTKGRLLKTKKGKR